MKETFFADAATRWIHRRHVSPNAIAGHRPAPIASLGWLVLVFVFALPICASGQPTSVAAKGLALNAAIDRALAKNKELAAFEFRFREQEARLARAGLLPNPDLTLELEDFAGGGRYDGFDRAQTTLSLGWVIEGGKRRHRVASADAASDLLSTDAEILRLDVAAETAHRFLTGLEDQARLKTAADALRLARETVEDIRRRTRAGRSSQAELSQAEAELSEAELAVDDVDHELSISYHRLAAQWGETEPDFEELAGDIRRLPRVASRESLHARFEKSPLLARLASEEQVAKADLRLAKARRWPSLRPRLGVRRYEEDDDFAVVAQVSIPIPIFDRNQGRVAESTAKVSRMRAEAEATRVRLDGRLFELMVELAHQTHRAAALQNDILPRRIRALEETRRGFESGRYDYRDWRIVQADLLEARAALLDASSGAHRLVITLERLTGESVTESGDPQ